MPKERRSRAWSVRLVLLAFSSRWARYPIAVTIIAIVVGIRAYVIPGWSLAHPYLLFYPAIMLAGWLGGFGPGVLAGWWFAPDTGAPSGPAGVVSVDESRARAARRHTDSRPP